MPWNKEYLVKNTIATPRGMLFHELVSMRKSKTKSILEYSSNVNIIFKKYFVTPRIKYLVMWKNIFPRVMDE
jgi:hypothetical protein